MPISSRCQRLYIDSTAFTDAIFHRYCKLTKIDTDRTLVNLISHILNDLLDFELEKYEEEESNSTVGNEMFPTLNFSVSGRLFSAASGRS